MSKSVTLSLALESGVLLAMHCHELLSVWLTYLTAETRETTKELNGISLGVGCPIKKQTKKKTTKRCEASWPLELHNLMTKLPLGAVASRVV